MITDARSQADVVAALHLEDLWDSARLSGAKVRATPSMQIESVAAYSQGRDAVRPPARLAFIQHWAVNPRGLSIKTDVARMQPRAPLEESSLLASRSAAKIADWRTYLPENCVRVMISNGWHRST